jgi:hypothetical protein
LIAQQPPSVAATRFVLGRQHVAGRYGEYPAQGISNSTVPDRVMT